MSGLTLSEKYMLCALNEKGKMSTFRGTQVETALTAAGLIDLLDSGCCRQADFRIAAVNSPGSGLAHLETLYDTVAEKPRGASAASLASAYACGGRRYRALLYGTGESLADRGYVRIGASRFGRDLYYPEPDAVRGVLDRTRGALMSSPDPGSYALAMLLWKSDLLGACFGGDARVIRRCLRRMQTTGAGELINRMRGYMDAVTVSGVMFASVYGR